MVPRWWRSRCRGPASPHRSDSSRARRPPSPSGRSRCSTTSPASCAPGTSWSSTPARAGATGGGRGYREQRLVADVLADPGRTDVTAGVDLAMVAAHARSRGFVAFEPVSQAAALAVLGHERWERTMREMQSMLQQQGRGSEAVRVWEARSRASLLADPAGFGRCWWLVLATDGLPEPAWLHRARALD